MPLIELDQPPRAGLLVCLEARLDLDVYRLEAFAWKSSGTATGIPRSVAGSLLEPPYELELIERSSALIIGDRQALRAAAIGSTSAPALYHRGRQQMVSLSVQGYSFSRWAVGLFHPHLSIERRMLVLDEAPTSSGKPEAVPLGEPWLGEAEAIDFRWRPVGRAAAQVEIPGFVVPPWPAGWRRWHEADR